MYRRFGILILSLSFFYAIFVAFLVDFQVHLFGAVSVGMSLRWSSIISLWLFSLWSCTLEPWVNSYHSQFGVLRSTRVLHVHRFDLQFCMIQSVWGLDHLDKACPWDKSSLPRISCQSIAWLGSLICFKFRVCLLFADFCSVREEQIVLVIEGYCP
jgi:hypothetical protein